jgi:hypothetical protein
MGERERNTMRANEIADLDRRVCEIDKQLAEIDEGEPSAESTQMRMHLRTERILASGVLKKLRAKQ